MLCVSRLLTRLPFAMHDGTVVDIFLSGSDLPFVCLTRLIHNLRVNSMRLMPVTLDTWCDCPAQPPSLATRRPCEQPDLS